MTLMRTISERLDGIKVTTMSSSTVQSSVQLQQSLSNRHLQLIAMGGAIGTGLFLGSGKTIHLAGPSIILGYLGVGIVLFFVMRAMGELLLAKPSYRSFIDFFTDLCGPWAGFFCGWTYWFCWIVTSLADVIAVANYVQFWWPTVPAWLSASLCACLLLSSNLMSVRWFGEAEFWFALIKLLAIVVIVMIGLGLIFFHVTDAYGHTASMRHLWSDGGWFPHGLTGFLGGCQLAVFAFVGIELVGATAAETMNPQQNLPQAINAIPIRIILFYVLALAMLMSVIPWRLITVTHSPFVDVFLLAKLPGAASLINFVVLTAASSSANSGLYSTSRIMLGLAQKNQAPKAFVRLSRVGIPRNGLLFSFGCLIVGIFGLCWTPNLLRAFTLVTTLAAVLFIFIWSMMMVAYLVYRRRYPQMHAQSRFPMPGGVGMCYGVLVVFASLLMLLSRNVQTRPVMLAALIWLSVLAMMYGVRFSRGTT